MTEPLRPPCFNGPKLREKEVPGKIFTDRQLELQKTNNEHIRRMEKAKLDKKLAKIHTLDITTLNTIGKNEKLISIFKTYLLVDTVGQLIKIKPMELHNFLTQTEELSYDIDSSLDVIFAISHELFKKYKISWKLKVKGKA